MSHLYVVPGPGIARAAAPISQAVVAGDHCYVSGQLATGRGGDLPQAPVRDQVERAPENLFVQGVAVRGGGDS